MEPPLVTCTGCGRHWHSATMAEGLQIVGACPRCGGELEFHDVAADAQHPSPAAGESGSDTPAPHLVLGIPRR